MSLEPGLLCLFESFIKRDEAPRAQSSHWVESCVIRSVSRSLRHYLYRASIQGKGFSRSILASYLQRIRKGCCFCNVTSFLLNLSVLKRNVCLVRISTADIWNRVAISLVSFNSTSKGRTRYSVLVIPSFNRVIASTTLL